MPIPGYHPKPAPPGVFGGQPLPEGNRDPISRLTFQWIAPIMKVGYSRPLELEGRRFNLSDVPMLKELVCRSLGASRQPAMSECEWQFCTWGL